MGSVELRAGKAEGLWGELNTHGLFLGFSWDWMTIGKNTEHRRPAFAVWFCNYSNADDTSPCSYPQTLPGSWPRRRCSWLVLSCLRCWEEEEEGGGGFLICCTKNKHGGCAFTAWNDGERTWCMGDKGIHFFNKKKLKVIPKGYKNDYLRNTDVILLTCTVSWGARPSHSSQPQSICQKDNREHNIRSG